MKDFLKTVAGIVLFIATVIGISTLVGIINHKPSVILTNTACNPPCWAGIQPNRTNSSQVYEILDQLDGVNKDSITADTAENNDKITEIYWDFQRPVQDSAGHVYFENDQVTAISILTLNSLKLEDLFKKLGQPEQYWTRVGYGEGLEYLEVFLLYPTKGYLADAVIDIENNVNQAEIQGSVQVFRVAYFAPEMLQELLKTQILIDRPVNAPAPAFHAWPGLGTIAFERK
jgi:hypothetical protein